MVFLVLLYFYGDRSFLKIAYHPFCAPKLHDLRIITGLSQDIVTTGFEDKFSEWQD